MVQCGVGLSAETFSAVCQFWFICILQKKTRIVSICQCIHVWFFPFIFCYDVWLTWKDMQVHLMMSVAPAVQPWGNPEKLNFNRNRLGPMKTHQRLKMNAFQCRQDNTMCEFSARSRAQGPLNFTLFIPLSIILVEFHVHGGVGNRKLEVVLSW